MKCLPILPHCLACILYVASLVIGQSQENNETFRQSLGSAAFIVVAKVEAGVQKDGNERALWRIVTVEKTLLDRTTTGCGLSRTWYAPMEDLGTDDYCVLVGFEVKGKLSATPPEPGDKLREDQLAVRQHTSEEEEVLHEARWYKRVIHPTEEMPDLQEALTQGYVLSEGKKVLVKDLAKLAHSKHPESASKADKNERDGANRSANRPLSESEGGENPTPESEPAPR